jgi:hypothetical protein
MVLHREFIKVPKIDKINVGQCILKEPDIFRREYPKNVLINEYIGLNMEKNKNV